MDGSIASLLLLCPALSKSERPSATRPSAFTRRGRARGTYPTTQSLAPSRSKRHSQLSAEYTQRSLSGACTRDASSFRATADEARTLIALTTSVGPTAEGADVTRIPSVPYAARTPLNREAPPPHLTPELSFMRDTFLYEKFGQELVAPLKSARVPGRYVIPSGQLCREYNRWRAENGLRDQVSNKRFAMRMVSHGTGYGIGRETSIKQYNAFNIDSDTLRAALTQDFGVVA